MQYWLGGTALETSPASSHSGSRSAHLVDGTYLHQPLEERFQLTYSTDGTLTVWVLNRSETMKQLYIGVAYSSSSGSGISTRLEVPPASEWVQLSVDLDTETPLNSLVIGSDGDLLVDDVSLNGSRFFILFAPLRMLSRWFGFPRAPRGSRSTAP